MSMGRSAAVILGAMGGRTLTCAVCVNEFTRAEAVRVLDENDRSFTPQDVQSATGVLRYECPRCGNFEPDS